MASEKSVAILSEGEGGSGNWVGLSKWGWLGERTRVQRLEDHSDSDDVLRKSSMVWGGGGGLDWVWGAGWAGLGVDRLTLVGISVVQKRG